MKYNCDICNYETHDFGNFSRHKTSKRHTRKCEEITSTENINKQNKKQSDDKVNINCAYCNKKFTTKTSMYRHQKHYCQLREKNDNKVKEIKNKTANQIEELKNKLDQVTKEKEQILSLANNSAQSNKKSISAMSYALKYFSNAPSIGLLEDDDFDKMSKLLMFDADGKLKTERSIEDVILHHHKQNTLHGILGDLIVKIYKKSNPTKQSAWSSDVARLTFIIKDIIGNNKKSKWIVDKKGIHFTETIINPLLERIKDLLTDYNNECAILVNKMSKKNKLDNEEESQIRSALTSMQEINLTLLTIKLRKIHNEILKYVAPYFNLDVKNVEDETECLTENSLDYSSNNSECENY